MKSDTSINNIDLNNSRIDLVGINPTEREKVVLVGNPNVGKSCVFNYLSSMYVDVSNFPGTTISITKCEYKNKSVYEFDIKC